jgi:hypothetical protein
MYHAEDNCAFYETELGDYLCYKELVNDLTCWHSFHQPWTKSIPNQLQVISHDHSNEGQTVWLSTLLHISLDLKIA